MQALSPTYSLFLLTTQLLLFGPHEACSPSMGVEHPTAPHTTQHPSAPHTAHPTRPQHPTRHSTTAPLTLRSPCPLCTLSISLCPQAGLSKALNQILQPVRDHFENNAEAKELLKKVRSYKVTK